MLSNFGQRWRLSVRLLIAFAAMVVAIVVMGVLAVVNLDSIDRSAQALYEHGSKPMAALADARVAIEANTRLVRQHLIAPDGAAVGAIEQQMRDGDGVAVRGLSTFAASATTPKLHDAAVEYQNLYRSWMSVRDLQLLGLSRSGSTDEAYAVIAKDLEPIESQMKSSGDQLFSGDVSSAAQLAKDAGRTKHDAIRNLALLAALAVGTALLLAVPLGRGIARAVSRSARNVRSTSSEMSEVSNEIALAVRATSTRADRAAASAGQVSESVADIARSVEEMTSAVKQVALDASKASAVAMAAGDAAARTNVTVSRLGESSTEIGRVIEVINSIAEQTNLLALNATIEAARAGEAGKGFAVVANEVKELAKQTAEATDEVTTRVAAIQADTQEAVDAISGITGVIEEIKSVQLSIAMAMETQDEKATEVARSVQGVAAGSAEIAQDVNVVAEAAAQAGKGVERTLGAADDLSLVADELRVLIEGAAGSSGSGTPSPPSRTGVGGAERFGAREDHSRPTGHDLERMGS